MAAEPQAIREFLQKLASDDEYRKYVKADPAKAIQEAGLDLHPDHLKGNVQLPPKEDIAANLEEYAAQGDVVPWFLIWFFQK